MYLYLKALGIHVYFATIKDSNCLNGKYLEVNVKAIRALKSTLNDDYLCRVSNLDSTFVVWNTIVSLGEQEQYYMGSDSDDGSDAFNLCYMVQGSNPLEVNSQFELEEDVVDMSYDELESFCQQLLEKYELLKKDNNKLKKNNTFKKKLECTSKENDFLKYFLVL